jgi:redox-sensitive bicupin YhaK (pirin superfamily)
MERFARLPVWPVWNGVLIWLVQKIAGNEVAAAVENAVTGRVGPNFYRYAETDPFIMLVHHCHSFAPLDPLRWFQRTFLLPEGFPAHPHRGFVTVTYFLAGGFVHRDSTGVRQSYGAESRHAGKHTQWLSTGRGVLHEEMFDLSRSPDGPLSSLLPRRQELYQIWLNVPARFKSDEPSTVLLGGDEETPVVVKESGEAPASSKTLVLAGEYQGRAAKAPIRSDLALFHVTLSPGATWTYDLPASYATAFLYLRRGSLTAAAGGDSDGTAHIPVHHTAYFEPTGDTCKLKAGGSREGADFVFLAGEPLREPCVAAGSMVMTSAQEIDQAYADYRAGRFGRPWSEKLSDEEWGKHLCDSFAASIGTPLLHARSLFFMCCTSAAKQADSENLVSSHFNSFYKLF